MTVTHSGSPGGAPATHPGPSAQDVSVVLGGSTPELPRINAIAASPTANEYIIDFAADPGGFFTLETSTDLQTWTASGSVEAASDENSVIVTSQPGDAERFWRLRRGQ